MKASASSRASCHASSTASPAACSATNYGGLGLGLYIARALVLSLSGTITVDSSPGQGASFSVTLPR